MNPIVGWLFSLILSFSPPEGPGRADPLPGHEETVAEKTARYASIAEDVYSVVYDPDTQPLYAGPKGRARTAILVLAIAYHESGFSQDVDGGPCYRGADGLSPRCDFGRSACIMQINVGDGTSPEGYTKAELFADRKKCIRSALARIRSSMGECKHLDEKHRLNAYASGVCTRGDEQSEELWSLAQRFAARVPMPTEDDAAFLVGAAETPRAREEPAAPREPRRRPRTPALRPNRTLSVSVAR